MKRSWSSDGQLVYEGEYENGQMSGRHVVWYRTGVKKESMFYNQGQITGEHQEWHPNGKLKYETVYGQDGNQGREHFWDAAGNALDYHPDEVPDINEQEDPSLGPPIN